MCHNQRHLCSHLLYLNLLPSVAAFELIILQSGTVWPGMINSLPTLKKKKKEATQATSAACWSTIWCQLPNVLNKCIHYMPWSVSVNHLAQKTATYTPERPTYAHTVQLMHIHPHVFSLTLTTPCHPVHRKQTSLAKTCFERVTFPLPRNFQAAACSPHARTPTCLEIANWEPFGFPGELCQAETPYGCGCLVGECGGITETIQVWRRSPLSIAVPGDKT